MSLSREEWNFFGLWYNQLQAFNGGTTAWTLSIIFIASYSSVNIFNPQGQSLTILVQEQNWKDKDCPTRVYLLRCAYSYTGNWAPIGDKDGLSNYEVQDSY